MMATRLAVLGSVLALAVLAIFLIVDDDRLGRPATPAQRERSAGAAPPLPPVDTLKAEFTLCDGPIQRNCVVDGDTFWFRGEKIRIADIDTPEISSPRCEDEKHVGAIARDRLLVLLSAGSFSLLSGWRDTDRYGRKLRTVARDNRSLGETLVEEGLARRWNEPRRNWCVRD